MSPTVTTIVPTYNRTEYLPECLDALFGQTHAPEQIIVVDDCSTDGTPAIVERCGSELQYIRQDQNAGEAAALNRSLRLATGDAI